jgi:rhamnulokinase
MRRLGLDAGILPAIREPGSAIGPLLPAVATSIGAEAGTQVTAVASHDTASAIVAVPALSDRFAYISCGTWSLVGMELTEPVLSEASQAANFTNEIGVDGTVRYLRNVIGLWPLQECLRSWQATGGQVELPALLELAAEVPPFANVVDLDDPVFLPPGDMPARLVTECRRLDQRGPTTPAEVVRCVLDSLALAHRRAVADVQQLTGRAIDTVHIVGGGARNELLCQLTADACDLPVVAGPQEATAMGNVLIQARALGAIPPELTQLRALVRRTQPMRTFSPQGNPSAWRAAANRIAGSRS